VLSSFRKARGVVTPSPSTKAWAWRSQVEQLASQGPRAPVRSPLVSGAYEVRAASQPCAPCVLPARKRSGHADPCRTRATP